MTTAILLGAANNVVRRATMARAKLTINDDGRTFLRVCELLGGEWLYVERGTVLFDAPGMEVRR